MPNHCRDFLPLVVLPEGSKRQGTFCATKKKKSPLGWIAAGGFHPPRSKSRVILMPVRPGA